MSHKVIITQSNYIPWKGYFDSINMVDTMVIYDDMQYTKRDWRNRNKIKTQNGLKWMSVPVEVKGKFNQKINETVISDPEWGKKHWAILEQNYRKAEFFSEYGKPFREFYLNTSEVYLSRVNHSLLNIVNKLLDISTAIRRSEEFELVGDKTEKLVNLCVDLGATDYYTGPAAKQYMDESKFEDKGINVHYLDYSGYSHYTQLFENFEHGVTILDLLFNTGPNAKNYLKSFI